MIPALLFHFDPQAQTHFRFFPPGKPVRYLKGGLQRFAALGWNEGLYPGRDGLNAAEVEDDVQESRLPIRGVFCEWKGGTWRRWLQRRWKSRAFSPLDEATSLDWTSLNHQQLWMPEYNDSCVLYEKKKFCLAFSSNRAVESTVNLFTR